MVGFCLSLFGQRRGRGPKPTRLPLPRLLLEILEGRDLPAPLTWFPGGSLPTAQGGVVAVQAADQSLLILGGSTTDVSRIWAANPAWQTSIGLASGPLEVPRLSPGVGVTPDGGILVFGGRNSDDGPLSSASHYDPTGDNTQDAASMSTARYLAGFATDESHHVYAIGGQDGQGHVLSSAEWYNQSTNTWTPIASLPQGLDALSAVADGAGYLFVFGGMDASGSLSSTVYRYTIATNTWDTVASLPVATASSAAVLGPNGLLYVLGGVTSSGATANVESYNETTNTWNIETPLPAAVSSEAAAVDALGQIVVAGGYDANHNATASVIVSQQLNQPDSAPVITSTPTTELAANATYTYQVLSTGNPQPTYSLTAYPAGMTVDPNTGLISWTATADQVGTQTVTVQASNFAGQATQTYTIQIVAPTITSSPRTTAVATSAYTYQVLSTGNPPTTYSLTAYPAGMTIDPSSGVIAWTPSVDEIGSNTVTVQASSIAGSATQTYTVNVLAPAPSVPTGLTAVGVSTSSILLSWNPSVAPGGTAVYNVYQRFFVHSPRGSGGGYTYRLLASNVTATSYTVASTGGVFLVSAVNTASGLASARSAPVTGVALSAPNLWGFTWNSSVWGSPVPVASGQSVQITLLAYGNAAPTFSVASGPSTVSVDPITGVATYTPAATELGLVPVTFQATNSVGTSTLTVTFDVMANPTVSVSGGPFTYDGTPHTAAATAVGLDGVTPVSGTFTFTYNGSATAPTAPGTYAVVATFVSSDPSYANATGSGSLTITRATPVFSSLSSPVITVGTASVTLSGHLAAGSAFPTGDTVSVTLHGVTQTAAVDASGNFTLSFATRALRVSGSPYTITYAYSGDGTDFNAAANGTSTLTVTRHPVAPHVVVRPYSRTVRAGQSVTFTAAATGYPAPTVQWQVSTDGGLTFTDLAGATDNRLTFTAQLSQNGYKYRAVFTSSAGTATTPAAKLTV
jgi:hypothetical protein